MAQDLHGLPALGEEAPHLLPQAGEELAPVVQKHRLLVGVVVEEGAPGDVGRLGDLRGRGLLEAPVAEKLHGGAEDPLPPPFFLVLAHGHGT